MFHSDDEGNVIIELDPGFGGAAFIPIPEIVTEIETETETNEEPPVSASTSSQGQDIPTAEPIVSTEPVAESTAIPGTESVDASELDPHIVKPSASTSAAPTRWARFKTWVCCCARHRKQGASIQLKDEPSNVK